MRIKHLICEVCYELLAGYSDEPTAASSPADVWLCEYFR